LAAGQLAAAQQSFTKQALVHGVVADRRPLSMSTLDRAAVPRVLKRLEQLNAENVFILDRAALAMLAATDGKSTVADIERVHGTVYTEEGLSKLLAVGAVRGVRYRAPCEVPTRGGIGAGPMVRRAALQPRLRSLLAWRPGLGAPAACAAAAAVVTMLLCLPFASFVASSRVATGEHAAAVTSLFLAGSPPVSDESDETIAACDGGARCLGAAPADPAAEEPVASEPRLPRYAPVLVAEAGPAVAPPVELTPLADVPSTTSEVPAPPASGSAPPATPAPSQEAIAAGRAPSTPDVTPSPTTSVAVTPSSTSAVALVPYLDERFADNRRGWPSEPGSTAWIATEGYRLFAREAGRFVAVGVPATPRLPGVSITGTFRKVGGPAGGGYGLIVRDQADSPRDGLNQDGYYYVFEVGDRGEVGIWRRERDHWADLLAWTPSPSVRTADARNELQVRAIGEQLEFIVNGEIVARQRDTTLGMGTVGIFVGGDGNQVVLERLLVEGTH